MLSLIIPNFDLDLMFESNIPLRWKKVNDGWYIVYSGEYACSIKQFKNNKVFYCSEEMFFNHWYYYFTVDIDYVPAYSKLKRFPEFKVKYAIDKFNNMRLLRTPLEETIVMSVLRHELKEDITAKMIFSDMLNNIGIPKKQTIQNIGRVDWKAIPPIASLCQFKPEQISDSPYCKKAMKRLIDISHRANETNLLNKIKEAEVTDIPDMLWELGLEDDEVSQVMLYSYAQLDNCPDSVLSGPIDLLFKVDPISYHEWYMDDLGDYYGLFGIMLNTAYNMDKLVVSNKTKMEYQIRQLKKRKKEK